MKHKMLPLLLTASLLLSGCSWFDGSYVSVVPRRAPHQTVQSGTLVASDYLSLMAALEEMISKGTQSAPIIVADYQLGSAESGMAVAVDHIKTKDPVGAYAVEEITYELGTSGGLAALAVDITYRHNHAEIQRIRNVKNVNQAEKAVNEALESCAGGVVLHIEDYFARDFTQVVRDYAARHPQTVMEVPQVTETVYGSEKSRVVELIFTYQTSRDSMRQMRSQVKPVFEAATLYVSGSGAQRQKFIQLYSFLMERFHYKIETSITPSYSLLCHGVGDSKAFATVYAAMCRSAGLECAVVTGTRSGQPYSWNMVLDNGQYYHVDLLKNHDQGQFRQLRDWEMSGYVWDYSAYPACNGELAEDLPEGTETTAATEETLPVMAE